MYCSNCGENIEELIGKCPKCGYKVKIDKKTRNIDDIKDRMKNFDKEKEAKKLDSMGIKGPIVVSLAIVIIFTIISIPWKIGGAIKGHEVRKQADLRREVDSLGYEIDLYEDGVIITDYLNQDRQLVIPETLMDKPILAIGEFAFYGCNISEIEMPDSIEVIGKDSFNGSNLTKLKCPANLKIIEETSFANCNHLAEVELNEGLEYIESSAFSNCKFQDIVIPSTIIELYSYSFDDYQKFRKIEFKEGEKEARIDDSVFSVVEEGINIVVPGNYTYIGSRNFYNAGSITIKRSTVGEEQRIEGFNCKEFHGTETITDVGSGFDKGVTTIYAPEESFLHEYALANEIDFVVENQ